MDDRLNENPMLINYIINSTAYTFFLRQNNICMYFNINEITWPEGGTFFYCTFYNNVYFYYKKIL